MIKIFFYGNLFSVFVCFFFEWKWVLILFSTKEKYACVMMIRCCESSVDFSLYFYSNTIRLKITASTHVMYSIHLLRHWASSVLFLSRKLHKPSPKYAFRQQRCVMCDWFSLWSRERCVIHRILIQFKLEVRFRHTDKHSFLSVHWSSYKSAFMNQNFCFKLVGCVRSFHTKQWTE